MNNKLHKRLEGAAKKYEPDAFDADYILPAREGFIVNGKRLAFYAGAEYGYKEVIAQTKEWILNNVHKYEGINGTIFHQSMADDFEADMNKLWEGEE